MRYFCELFFSSSATVSVFYVWLRGAKRLNTPDFGDKRGGENCDITETIEYNY